VQAMKSVNEIKFKNFLDKGLTNESAQRVSDTPLFLDLMRKQEMDPPIPYCLCHKIDLETSMLERKHCMAKDCPHLVFVKEIWTAYTRMKKFQSSREQRRWKSLDKQEHT
jgi:hypothetical protein